VSEAGDRIHVLVQAPASAGWSLDWGLVTLDVATGHDDAPLGVVEAPRERLHRCVLTPARAPGRMAMC
jgi:hypothetical protein